MQVGLVVVQVGAAVMVLVWCGVGNPPPRLRTICEVEQAAANNPLTRLAINTIK